MATQPKSQAAKKNAPPQNAAEPQAKATPKVNAAHQVKAAAQENAAAAKKIAPEAKAAPAKKAAPKARPQASVPDERKGWFDVIHDENATPEIDIRPISSMKGTIPEAQKDVQQTAYSTWGTLKYLEAANVFSAKKESRDLTEFKNRIRQAAEVGLEGDNVRPALAALALRQIRQEIALRVGKAAKLQYLRVFGFFGCAMAVLMLVVVLKSPVTGNWSALGGYAWVVIGAMVGAWISIASARNEVLFDELPDILIDDYFEPAARIVFVTLLAVTLALFLDLGVLNIKVGSVDLGLFSTRDCGTVANTPVPCTAQGTKIAAASGALAPSRTAIALLLGVIAGIGEKALSVRLVERARAILTSSK